MWSDTLAAFTTTPDLMFAVDRHEFGNRDELSLGKDRPKTDSREARIEKIEDQLCGQQAQLSTQNIEIRKLEALCQETKCERAAILNAESISRVWATQAERNNRNAAAHGGNVLADIQVIDEMEQDDPAKARLWKKAFFRLYHLHYAEVHLPLLYPPPEPSAVTRRSLEAWGIERIGSQCIAKERFNSNPRRTAPLRPAE
ncbi:hypothetical protein V8E54_008365 [Elaphomyces granulatus]